MKSRDSQRLLKHYDAREKSFIISIPSGIVSFTTHESTSEILLTARFCNESPEKVMIMQRTETERDLNKTWCRQIKICFKKKGYKNKYLHTYTYKELINF